MRRSLLSPQCWLPLRRLRASAHWIRLASSQRLEPEERVGEKTDLSRLIAAESIARRFDGGVAGSIALLVILSPLAFGSVHPWAYSLIEATVFVLVLLWMSKVLLIPQAGASEPPALAGMLAPIGVFLAVVAFDLVPMPPAMIRLLSPATWRVYAD